MLAIPYYDWIAHHAGRRPTKLAIHDLQTGRKFTYADIDHRTDRLAAALAGLGIAKGDRVGLLAPNCTEYFELQFACGRSAPSCCHSIGGSPCRSWNTSWATRPPCLWF